MKCFMWVIKETWGRNTIGKNGVFPYIESKELSFSSIHRHIHMPLVCKQDTETTQKQRTKE